MSLKITKIHPKAKRPATETIEFSVSEKINLRHYAVTDNTYNIDGEISNVHQHFYKFPNQIVNKGDKIILHTGKGTNAVRKRPVGATTDIYDYYCGSDSFIWNDTGDAAKLYYLNFMEKVEIPAQDSKKS